MVVSSNKSEGPGVTCQVDEETEQERVHYERI